MSSHCIAPIMRADKIMVIEDGEIMAIETRRFTRTKRILPLVI